MEIVGSKGLNGSAKLWIKLSFKDIVRLLKGDWLQYRSEVRISLRK